MAGAILAAALLLVVAKGTAAGYDPAVAGFAANGYGAHSPGGYGMAAAFIVETVLTAFLVLTILGRDRHQGRRSASPASPSGWSSRSSTSSASR